MKKLTKVLLVIMVFVFCVPSTASAQDVDILPPEEVTIYFDFMPFLDANQNNIWDNTEVKAITATAKCYSGDNVVIMIATINGVQGSMQAVLGRNVSCFVKYIDATGQYWTGRFFAHVLAGYTYERAVPLWKTGIYLPFLKRIGL